MAKMYVIRFKDRKESAPISESDVRKLIASGEVKEDDKISVYPDQFAIQASSYPEFESLFEDEEKTSIIDPERLKSSVHDEKTGIFTVKKTENTNSVAPKKPEPPESEDVSPFLKNEKTGSIEVPESLRKKQASKPALPKKKFLLLLVLFIAVYQQMQEEQDESEKAKNPVIMQPIKPKLPTLSTEGKPDPIKSEKIYREGLKPYYQDTVSGYRKATDFFHLALKYDPQNVTALSMLASSYLNLIESSNQDEKTFSVINKLIELSKVKQAETVETLVAELEFQMVSRRYDSAFQRLTEYAKINSSVDARIFYYLGMLLHLRGDNAGAIQNLNMIPISNFPVPKLFYLIGKIYEENGQYDEALAEYKRALKINKHHAKSIQGYIRIMEIKGALKSKEIITFVKFLQANPSLQSPHEYVESLIFYSKVALLYKNEELAIQSLSQAIRLDPENGSLKLEYYSLLSKSQNKSKYGKLAKMYSLILEGERFAKEGKIHEAVAMFIQAKDSFPKSSVPVEKMGDLFFQLGEFPKALNNYRNAVKLDPKARHLAVKIIKSAIESQDWEEAQKLLAKFRSEPSLKSSIDRLAGDLAAKQGFDQQAIAFYLKAMTRDSIDTQVYSAYADILRKNDRCKDAQFFYSVAQKFDPDNLNAILGASKCFLKTDGLKIAVSRLQEELTRRPKVKADLLSAIAEIYLIGGNEELALNFTEQAIDSDPTYPESYRIKAMVYLNQMAVQKESKRLALKTLGEYADRKPTDTFSYLKRFDIYLKDSDFQHAEEELNRIFEISPRFPDLHFKRAIMYSKMGKIKDALVELDEELKIFPKSIRALDERGNILVKLNQLDEAMKSYVRSMELEPKNPDSKMGAGYVNYLKRRFDSAIALYQSALALDKGNPEIHKKLGQAYRDSGDPQNAGKYFRNYLDLAPDAPDRKDYDQYR
jgi:tetratricopeptide (TPR) repeat protein